jgi:hypothetical protein
VHPYVLVNTHVATHLLVNILVATYVLVNILVATYLLVKALVATHTFDRSIKIIAVNAHKRSLVIVHFIVHTLMLTCRVGRNHTNVRIGDAYMHIQYFKQGSACIFGRVRCAYMVLATPTHL